MAQEALTEGFGFLAEVIANGIRPAIALAPRDDHRGLTDAFDEAQLARWVLVQCSQAGLDLDKARFIPYGGGQPPAEILSAVRTIMETV